MFIFGFLCVSILGFEKVLQNKITQNLYQVDDLDSYIDYPNKNTFIVQYFSGFVPTSVYQKPISLLMYILYLINYILNDLIFMVFFLLVEILTILQLKFSLKKKLRTEKFNSNCTKTKFNKMEIVYNVSLKCILINTSFLNN